MKKANNFLSPGLQSKKLSFYGSEVQFEPNNSSGVSPKVQKGQIFAKDQSSISEPLNIKSQTSPSRKLIASSCLSSNYKDGGGESSTLFNNFFSNTTMSTSTRAKHEVKAQDKPVKEAIREKKEDKHSQSYLRTESSRYNKSAEKLIQSHSSGKLLSSNKENSFQNLPNNSRQVETDGNEFTYKSSKKYIDQEFNCPSRSHSQLTCKSKEHLSFFSASQKENANPYPSGTSLRAGAFYSDQSPKENQHFNSDENKKKKTSLRRSDEQDPDKSRTVLKERKNFEGEPRSESNVVHKDDEVKRRKGDIILIYEEIERNMSKKEALKSCLKEETNRLHQNLCETLEGIEDIKNDLIKNICQITEDHMLMLNENFQKELRKIDQLSEELEIFSGEVLGTKDEINSNFHKIVGAMSPKEFKTNLNQHIQKIKRFSNVSRKIKDLTKQTKLRPCEELLSFEMRLRYDLEKLAKLNRSEEPKQKGPKSTPLRFNTKNKSAGQDQLDNSRISKEKEVMHKNISNPMNYQERMNSPVFISFENKDIFENAIQSAVETISGGNTTLDTAQNVFTSHAFKSTIDECNSTFLSDALRTPRLNFELWSQPAGDINEFREDDEGRRHKSVQDYSILEKSKFTKTLEEMDFPMDMEEGSKSMKTRREYNNAADLLKYIKSSLAGCKNIKVL